jgi:Fe-S cluster assembly iron-binding protein IscA
MFAVTEEALENIKKFQDERKGAQPIRILMSEEGWKGPHLVMALDEQKDNDEVFAEKGATFVIEKALFDRVKPIRIGYTHSTLGSGYTLESELMKGMKGVNVGCHEICNSCDTVTS